MTHTIKALNALKKFRDRVTHEVPTGPHTDVRSRKINPSFKKKLTGVGAGTQGGFGAAKKKPKKFQHGGRTNLLEELGRVEAEPSNRNRRAEISRVHGELNRGYAKGGRSGYGSGGAVLKGKKVGIQIK